MIEVRDGSVLRTLKGFTSQINSMVEVKETELLVTAGDNSTCCVFDVSKDL